MKDEKEMILSSLFTCKQNSDTDTDRSNSDSENCPILWFSSARQIYMYRWKLIGRVKELVIWFLNTQYIIIVNRTEGDNFCTCRQRPNPPLSSRSKYNNCKRTAYYPWSEVKKTAYAELLSNKIWTPILVTVIWYIKHKINILHGMSKIKN